MLVPLRSRLVSPAAACVLLLAACSGCEADGSSEVATLQSGDEAVGDAADAAVRTETEPAGDLAPDEAALQFSQCMRDQGLDFPDLSVDAEGNIQMREAFQAVDPQAEGFREAIDACGAVLQQTGFGGGRRQALDDPAVQDALLEFSQCVRDAGYDVGDLTLGGPGPGGSPAGQNPDDGQAAGAGPGQGQGQRQGGFGNRTARFAEQLGLDPDDPDVQETLESCSPIIDEAVSGAGVGPGRGGE